MRKHNHGLRKICTCRSWSKCGHAWHFNYRSHRFSLDAELGYHIEGRTRAEAAAEELRKAIRAGTFQRRAETPQPSAPTTPDVITLDRFWTLYTERLGKPVSANSHACFKGLAAFVPAGGTSTYGAKAIGAFTEDDLDAFFGQLRAKGFAASTRNKYIQTVKALFRWATKKGYLTRNPAAEADTLTREKHAQRHRRLEPDTLTDTGQIEREGEERRLLAVANPHLQRLVIAALETGCRRGELLLLQWRDVSLERREMTIRAAHEKTKSGRVIPVSARLLAVLQMATTDPTGQTFGPEAYVFGDAVGLPVKDFKKAWETAVLKAHGHTPIWRGTSLEAASWAALEAIDLHFHDLRHEAGSRLLEAGWPIHTVAHMLGHANISQTSTYLNATRIGLQDAMRRLDDARTCKKVASQSETAPAPSCKSEANDSTQDTVN